MDKIESIRRTALAKWYASSDLDGYQIEHANGWEYSGDIFTRVLFVIPDVPTEDNGSANPTLTVTFKPDSDEITNLTIDGQPMNDLLQLRVQALLAKVKEQKWEEDALDETVHEVAQKAKLAELNAIEDEKNRDDHISSVESTASEINNGGLEDQIRYLLKEGVTEDEIEKAGKGE